jgi:hypothetical protein
MRLVVPPAVATLLQVASLSKWISAWGVRIGIAPGTAGRYSGGGPPATMVTPGLPATTWPLTRAEG